MPRAFRRQIARLWSYSPIQRVVLLKSLVLLPLVWLFMRIGGLQRTLRWLARIPVSRGKQLSRNEAGAVGDAVNTAAAHAFGPVTCLSRSLVLYLLLKRLATLGDLRIGVRIVEGKLFAHAWVEYGDVPINDFPDVASRYAPFDGVEALHALI